MRGPTRTTTDPLPQAPDGSQATDDTPTADLQDPCSTDYEQSAQDVYQVEKILRQRRLNGEHQFLIKWLGFPHSQNTWEPASNIIDKRSITEFYHQHPRAKRFNDDPDYHPRMAVFVSADVPMNSQIIAAFSHEIIGPSSSVSRLEITNVQEPPSPRVTNNDASRECAQPLPGNPEDAMALTPLTSERLHGVSNLEMSPSSNPLTGEALHEVHPNDISP